LMIPHEESATVNDTATMAGTFRAENVLGVFVIRWRMSPLVVPRALTGFNLSPKLAVCHE